MGREACSTHPVLVLSELYCLLHLKQECPDNNDALRCGPSGYFLARASWQLYCNILENVNDVAMVVVGWGRVKRTPFIGPCDSGNEDCRRKHLGRSAHFKHPPVFYKASKIPLLQSQLEPKRPSVAPRRTQGAFSLPTG